MSGKNNKLHRKMSVITFGTKTHAKRLKQRWELLPHREKGKVRKKLQLAIKAHRRAQVEVAIESSVVQEQEGKKF
jgi:endonuclease III